MALCLANILATVFFLLAILHLQTLPYQNRVVAIFFLACMAAISNWLPFLERVAKQQVVFGLVLLCPLHTYWSLVACVLGRSRKYETEIAASRLLKSRFQVELNSTGSDRVVLALATSSDLLTSLS